MEQKISSEFLSDLKNTSDRSKKSLSKSKENQLPLPASNPHKERKRDQNSNYRVVEGDFSKISCCYVLQGNILKKKELYGKKENKTNVQEETKIQSKQS